MTLAPTALRKLEELEATKASPAVCAELRRLIEHGSDLDLYKMNAYRLGRDAGVPVEVALRTLLFGTRLGIFDLNYDVYCPECRGNTEYAKHLMGLESSSHCNLCTVDFKIEFLEQIEVTFTVNPGVRAIEIVDFKDRDPRGKVQWFGEVARRNERFPTLIAQFAEPGSTRAMTGVLAIGSYDLYAPRDKAKKAVLVVVGQPTTEIQRAQAAAHEDGRMEPERLTFRPGPVEITTTSQIPNWPILGIRQGEPAQWMSATFVTSQQEFRDLFGGDYLAPGVTFAVRSATVMFTDIRSSTEMFEELGDSPAYALVQDHFTTLGRIIGEHRGGIVKTIGDAVMATFASNIDAVNAAIAIQQAFQSEVVRGRRLELKIGLHRGPMIAVTSNRNLDYFGRTVNMAARVQSTSRPGEVVLSDEVVADPAVASVLAGVRHEVVHAALKGIGEGLRLHRLFVV